MGDPNAQVPAKVQAPGQEQLQAQVMNLQGKMNFMSAMLRQFNALSSMQT